MIRLLFALGIYLLATCRMGSVYGGGNNDPFDKVHDLAKNRARVGDENVNRGLEDLAINGIRPEAAVVPDATGNPAFWQSDDMRDYVASVAEVQAGQHLEAMRDVATFGLPVSADDDAGSDGEGFYYDGQFYSEAGGEE